MDSKQLFRLYHSKFHRTNWLNKSGEPAKSDGDVEWFYCGLKDDFKYDFVSQAINDTFPDDEVYLFISSGNSSLVPKSVAVKAIGNNLHKKEIGVMNPSFTKIMEFATYGVFKIGIIREFPASRPKPHGIPLKVAFHANIMDASTERAAHAVSDHLERFEKALNRDYGGVMEHLWIDLELIESHKSWPFRFQKKVGTPASYTEFYSYNVGHYSVRPDFEKLRGLSEKESICSYIFELLYDSTQILVDRQKNIGDFDATAFRFDFLSACKEQGYCTNTMR